MKASSMPMRFALANRALLRRCLHAPLAVCCLLLFTTLSLSAQDFGFGFDDEDAGGASSAFGGSGGLAVSIGGEVSAGVTGFVDDFSDGADAVRLGDIFSGKLNFTAENSYAKGVINLKFAAPGGTEYTDYVDEAYVRAWFGKFDVEGGVRKLIWGKADSSGPLDVINPLDYSDLTILIDQLSDNAAQKTARPLVHASLQLGQFSKLEGIFVPNFEPVHFDEEGRWIPDQIVELKALEQQGLTINRPDTTTLNYAQAGLRFTTTIGSADIGAQYYYGRLTVPAANIVLAPLPVATPQAVNVAYNPYHLIGADWAQVISGFNIRAELAANLTDDFDGDDGAVYNQSLAWSLGFDRDLFAGLNLNLQAVQTVILRHDRINGNPLLDIEAESDITTTRITAKLSKTFLQDRLEITGAAIWGIEDKDCLIMPVVTWTQNDVALELSGGIFAGDRDGQFGQYHKNNFVRLLLKYMF
jgi:hypothetical protein